MQWKGRGRQEIDMVVTVTSKAHCSDFGILQVITIVSKLFIEGKTELPYDNKLLKFLTGLFVYLIQH